MFIMPSFEAQISNFVCFLPKMGKKFIVGGKYFP